MFYSEAEDHSTFNGTVFVTGQFVEDNSVIESFDKSLFAYVEKKYFTTSHKPEKRIIPLLKKGGSSVDEEVDKGADRIKLEKKDWDAYCIKTLGKSLEENKKLQFPGNTARRVVVNGSLIAVISKTGELYMTSCKSEMKNRPIFFGQETELELQEEMQLMRLKNFSRVTEVSVGRNHCAVIVGDGVCWLWGYNTAISNNSIVQTIKSKGDKRDKSIDGRFAALHNIELNSRTGQIGVMDLEKSAHPIKLEFSYRVARVACGDNMTVILTTKGKVFTFGGFNESGELGRKTPPEEERHLPRIVEGDIKEVSVVQIAAGSFHVLALSNNGKIYSWGNNEWGLYS